jgi:fructuronate reductase
MARRPVRIAHLGLGAFHRAHQAWYTQHAGESAEDWGIAAFTGRTPDAARALAAQGGRYTLIERGAERDRAEIVDAIVAAHDGRDRDAWRGVVADPRTAVVTLTVTEAGYEPDATPAARLVDALAARRLADAGPIALVSCDNLLGNGRRLRELVRAAADDPLREWIDLSVSFVDTMVDRITPATTDADRATAHRLTGMDDACTVVAEPFHAWVLAGAFPAGRPEWGAAGARFVDDVTPYEESKLWLLNAGHSYLAYAGRLRGHTTLDEAFADDALRAGVEQLWAEQGAVIDLPESEVQDSLAALRDRFAHPRMGHRLDQIARDGARKLPPRILAPARRRRERGLPMGEAQLATVGAWAQCLLRFGADDAASADVIGALGRAPASRRTEVALASLSTEGTYV